MQQDKGMLESTESQYFLMRKWFQGYTFSFFAWVVGVCWVFIHYGSLIKHWLWGVNIEVEIFALGKVSEWWQWVGLSGVIAWSILLWLKVYHLLPISWRWELLPNYEISEDLDPDLNLETIVKTRPRETWIEVSLIFVGIVGSLWYLILLMSGWYWNEQGVQFRTWPDFRQQTIAWEQTMRLETEIENFKEAGVLPALVLKTDDPQRIFRFWGKGQEITQDTAELTTLISELEKHGVEIKLIEDWPSLLPKEGNRETARGYWSMYAQLVEGKKAQQIKKQMKLREQEAEVMAVYTLGLEAWLDRKDYRTAAKYYQEALEMDGDFVPALASLGYLKAEFMGQAKEGEAMMKQAMALDPEYPYAPFNLAIFYNLHGRSKEARELMEMVVTKFKDHPDIEQFENMYAVMKSTV